MDTISKERRSRLMGRVRATGNASTELRLIQIFRQLRLVGWRRIYPIFGKPDFVFPKSRIAIFLDGDFWHGHPKRGRIPKTNVAFWTKKIAKNKTRDRLVNRTLRAKNWRVIRIWEGDLSLTCVRRRVMPHIYGQHQR